jgi:hypothetical protein
MLVNSVRRSPDQCTSWGVAESCSEIYNRLIVEYYAEAENRSLPNTYQWAIDIENTKKFYVWTSMKVLKYFS